MATNNETNAQRDAIILRAATAIYEMDISLPDEYRTFEAEEMRLLHDALTQHGVSISPYDDGGE